MADVIKVSTEELISAVNKYSSTKTQLENAYLQMYRNVHGLDGSYIGDASEALKSQFEQMYKNIEQTEAKVEDAIEELTKTADIVNEVEDGLKAAFQNLDVGTDPFSI